MRYRLNLPQRSFCQRVDKAWNRLDKCRGQKQCCSVERAEMLERIKGPALEGMEQAARLDVIGASATCVIALNGRQIVAGLACLRHP